MRRRISQPSAGFARLGVAQGGVSIPTKNKIFVGDCRSRRLRSDVPPSYRPPRRITDTAPPRPLSVGYNLSPPLVRPPPSIAGTASVQTSLEHRTALLRFQPSWPTLAQRPAWWLTGRLPLSTFFRREWAHTRVRAHV